MLKAVTEHGDPVELNEDELDEVIAALQLSLRRLKAGDGIIKHYTGPQRSSGFKRRPSVPVSEFRYAMRQRRLLIFALMLTAFGALVLFLISDRSISGDEEARQDIRRGHLELRGYGDGPIPEYRRLLKSRLGVEYRTVAAGDIIPATIDSHTTEYNEVMREEIERRYGGGILIKIADEANRTHTATRPAA